MKRRTVFAIKTILNSILIFKWSRKTTNKNCSYLKKTTIHQMNFKIISLYIYNNLRLRIFRSKEFYIAYGYRNNTDFAVVSIISENGLTEKYPDYQFLCQKFFFVLNRISVLEKHRCFHCQRRFM